MENTIEDFMHYCGCSYNEACVMAQNTEVEYSEMVLLIKEVRL